MLEKKEKMLLMALATGRLFTNFLDISALAGLALMGLIISEYLSPESQSTVVQVPLFGALGISQDNLIWITVSVAFLFLLKGLLAIFFSFLQASTISWLETKVTRKASELFFRPSQRGFGKKASLSEFQNNVLASSSALGGYVNAYLNLAVESTLFLLIFGAFLLTNVYAALGLASIFLAVLITLNRALASRIRLESKTNIDSSARLLTLISDFFSVRKEAYLSKTDALWISAILREKRSASLSAGKVGALQTVPRHVLEASIVFAAIVFGIVLLIVSDISSQAVTVTVFVGGSLRLMAAVLPIQGALQAMSSCKVQSKPVLDYLGQEKQLQSAPMPFDDNLPTLSSKVRAIAIENISFSYPESSKKALSEVTLRFESRGFVAITGPSGSGKSTLMDILGGFLAPSSGGVFVELEDGGKLALLAGRGEKHGLRVSIVPQSPKLITGTLAENVTLDLVQGAELDKVMSALEWAGLGAKAREIGLMASLAPGVSDFSGGEIQRLGIARSLYQDPDILLLDEVTSSLDGKTERQILKEVQKLATNRLVITVAHRNSVLEAADSVVLIVDGSLRRHGKLEDVADELLPLSKARGDLDNGKRGNGSELSES